MLKKNPLMSLWLSAANAAASSARGRWTGEVRRQQSAITQQFAKQMTEFWSGAWGTRSVSRAPSDAPRRPRKAKRRA
jgi:hypothetical protein